MPATLADGPGHHLNVAVENIEGVVGQASGGQRRRLAQIDEHGGDRDLGATFDRRNEAVSDAAYRNG